MTSGAVLILGGTSDIGLAIARRYAAERRAIWLAARDVERAEAAARDLRIRFEVETRVFPWDAERIDAVPEFVGSLPRAPSVTVAAAGLLPDPDRVGRDPELARRTVTVNFLAPALALEAIARRMHDEDVTGVLVGIGSVAGDRGRASNAWYGAAKAGFHTVLEGLRQRVRPHGIHVVVIKPGFVATRMTVHMELPPLITATPERIARLVHRAVARHRPTVYPFEWRVISLVVRVLPERLLGRL